MYQLLPERQLRRAPPLLIAENQCSHCRQSAMRNRYWRRYRWISMRHTSSGPAKAAGVMTLDATCPVTGLQKHTWCCCV